MKSFSYHFLSAIGAGALAAFFLHTNPAALRLHVPVVAHAKSGWTLVSNSHARGEMEAAAPAHFSFAEQQPILEPAPAGTPRLLLNEPVDILNHANATWTYLPRGTSVLLLADRGPLLQVRHGNDIVTVPRTTIMAGAARTN